MRARIICPATPEHPRNTEASIVELAGGTLLLAWSRFVKGASDDSAGEIAVMTSPDGGESWSEPRVLQSNTGAMNVMSASLLRLRDGGIGFLYLRKDSHTQCTAYFRRSDDDGRGWGEAVHATPFPGYTPVLNDAMTQLRDGRILVPYETSPECWSDKEHYTAGVCWSDDGGGTWRRCQRETDCPKRGAMEPVVLERGDGTLLMAIRTQVGSVWHSTSADRGRTWSEARDWGVTSPEAPALVKAAPSGGIWLMVWNNAVEPGSGHGGPRRPLVAAVSRDEGRSWGRPTVLEEDPECTTSYPSIAFRGAEALLTYYVARMQEALGRKAGLEISLAFRRLPLSSLAS